MAEPLGPRFGGVQAPGVWDRSAGSEPLCVGLR